MNPRSTAVEQEKTRDADRSREAILRAAEDLFSERGFDGVSLGEIAATAALSRGAPSYFFGSKGQLYQAVLERVFEDREKETRCACEPLVAWASSEGRGSIEHPLTEAVSGYLDFLLGRPSFFKLVQREELAGAARLRKSPRESKAIEEAFGAVRAATGKRGLKEFEPNDVVLLFVSMTFFPVAQSSTFMTALGRNLREPGARDRHVRLVVDQLLHLTGSASA